MGSGSTDVGGVYRSTDGGVNWTKMTNGLIGSIGFGATDVVVDPTNTNIAYAADWSDGIYKTTDANAVVQPTWTKLTNGLPLTGSFTRVSLAISPSSPQTLYALIANNDYIIDGFYRTVNGGVSWNSIALPSALPGGQIGWGQGFYNLVVAVDPTTPDIVYLGAIFLWKAVRNPVTNTWTFTDISETIHVDNHAFAFDPTNHLIIYSGNDGGIYRSNDGGVTWIDSINKGLCITQFEFMDQYRTSDSVVVVGTQDNGTQQFRGSPVFYLSDFGDGGYVSVDPTDPSNNLVHVTCRL